jgi:tetratricopeptide (TPR) repeat protein
MRSLAYGAIIPVILLAISPIFAASQRDYDDCVQATDQDRRIAGCTQIINDFGESQHNQRLAYENRGLAWHFKGNNDQAIADYTEAIRLNPNAVIAYNNRGTAWRDKGNLDRAIADYTHAIRLNPNDAPAFNNRGNAWHEKGENNRAIIDYTEAIRLDPKYAVAYNNRGNAWRAKGDNNRAIADCTEATRLDPKNPVSYRICGYTHFDMGDFSAAAEDLGRANGLGDDGHALLWRFLALGHLGQDGATELRANAAWLRVKEWPYPVIEFYLARRSLEDTRAAGKASERSCEVEFYAGEWRLLRGEVKEAQTALRAGVDRCPKISKEYHAALAELRRLKR